MYFIRAPAGHDKKIRCGKAIGNGQGGFAQALVPAFAKDHPVEPFEVLCTHRNVEWIKYSSNSTIPVPADALPNESNPTGAQLHVRVVMGG